MKIQRFLSAGREHLGRLTNPVVEEAAG
jgi:hypothetical protein